MSTTDFTPERSAAIRQLLIDTVADEPRRRKRLQILLTSVLSGVALVLAGGTAALALSGVIHLGGGETPPAPVPSPTQTVTPTPTPTPTPTATPTERPLVQTAPVLPHDVDQLRATQRWSLDLPGDPECTGTITYTLSDARAVYVSGLRPKEYEGSDCINQVGEDMGVTLVDTSNGQILWQREWTFTPKSMAFGTGFAVLGTSGRAVFASPEAGTGPHDVLDLATGRTVGTFEPGWEGFRPNRDMEAVPGDSGDVVVVQHFWDADGRAVSDDVVTRADPSDFGHPRWSVPVGLRGVDLGAVAPGGTAMELQGYVAASSANQTVLLDLQTASTSSVDGFSVQPMSQILYARSSSQLSAYSPAGQLLWSRPLAEGSSVSPAYSPGTTPGLVNGYRMPDTGELFILDPSSLTLIDQTTGEVRWTIPTPACMRGDYDTKVGVLDVRRDAFLLPSSEPECAVSHSTGQSVEAPSLPNDRFSGPIGLTHRYTYAFGADDPGSAYDLQTGDRLWTRERHDYDSWSFDGGYLVSHHRNHIESIG